MNAKRKSQKINTMLKLHNLRKEIEEGREAVLSEDLATLLTDVCITLGITADADLYYIVGEGYANFMDRPIPYFLTAAGAFAAAFGQPVAEEPAAVGADNGATLRETTE